MTSHGATSRRSLLYGHRSTPEGGSRVAWLPPRSPPPITRGTSSPHARVGGGSTFSLEWGLFVI